MYIKITINTLTTCLVVCLTESLFSLIGFLVNCNWSTKSYTNICNTHACTSTHVQAQMYRRTQAHTHTHACTHTHTHTHACAHVHTHTHIHEIRMVGYNTSTYLNFLDESVDNDYTHLLYFSGDTNFRINMLTCGHITIQYNLNHQWTIFTSDNNMNMCDTLTNNVSVVSSLFSRTCGNSSNHEIIISTTDQREEGVR